MIKKTILLLILTSSTILNTQAGDFYLKGGIGVNTIRPIKVSNQDMNGKIKLTQEFPLIEVGIGYNWSNRVRSEVVADYYFKFISKEHLKDECNNSLNVHTKTKISALMFNSYVDILKFEKVSLFVGGGIGLANKIEHVTGHGVVSDDLHVPMGSEKNKRNNKFAYKLTTGLDLKANENLNVELSYNFYDLGRNKSAQNTDNIIRKRHYLVHNLTMGIRYSL